MQLMQTQSLKQGSATGTKFIGMKFMALIVFTFVLMLIAGTANAVDLTALSTIAGPLGDALTQMDSLSTGMKALIGFIAFAVAFISLAALKNFGPVLFYIGAMIFGAVGLAIGGAILGAVV